MNKAEKKKIKQGVLEITDRVLKNGRESEAVKINVDITLKGQEAINYKVMRLFKRDISDQELVTLTFRMGIDSGKEILKHMAHKHGIGI